MIVVAKWVNWLRCTRVVLSCPFFFLTGQSNTTFLFVSSCLFVLLFPSNLFIFIVHYTSQHICGCTPEYHLMLYINISHTASIDYPCRVSYSFLHYGIDGACCKNNKHASMCVFGLSVLTTFHHFFWFHWLDKWLVVDIHYMIWRIIMSGPILCQLHELKNRVI